MSLVSAIEYHAARAMMALPPGAQVRLSRQPPVTVDGGTLHPQLQLLLSGLELQGKNRVSEDDPVASRAAMRRDTMTYAGPPEPVAGVSRLAAANGMPARHYAPEESRPRPLLVWYHGGGHVQGDLDSYDNVCRLLCRHAGVHVVAPDYRLAPEDPFPCAVEDAQAVFEWAVQNAERLGADPQRVAVGGDSAGGNLAAVVARDGRPAAQVLVYPVTDMSQERPSYELFGEGFLLTRADIRFFRGHYMGEQDRGDPRASPLLAADLSDASPALLATAHFDPLRDEGEAYAIALRDAGVATVAWRVPGLIHGFLNLAGVSPACRDAAIGVAGALRALLGGR